MKRVKSVADRTKQLKARIVSRLKQEADEPTILISLVVLTAGVGLVAILLTAIPNSRDGYLPGVFIEFNGMLLDVIVFGVIAAWLLRRSDRRQQRQRQQETIDDYKKWDTEEGKLRVAGAVRRLIRLGTTSIDFGGLETTDFSFARHDIKSIRGSTFYDGTWGTSGSRDRVTLEKVDFGGVDCRDVTFSQFNPLPASWGVQFALLKDCNFVYAKLEKAVFNGAHLEWTTEHPQDCFEYDEENGSSYRVHYPPFCDAQLEGASFRDVTFKNADLRGAIDVLECDFTGARGLESCLFDDEKTREAVLKMAKGPEAEAT